MCTHLLLGVLLLVVVLVLHLLLPGGRWALALPSWSVCWVCLFIVAAVAAAAGPATALVLVSKAGGAAAAAKAAAAAAAAGQREVACSTPRGEQNNMKGEGWAGKQHGDAGLKAQATATGGCRWESPDAALRGVALRGVAPPPSDPASLQTLPPLLRLLPRGLPLIWDSRSRPSTRRFRLPREDWRLQLPPLPEASSPAPVLTLSSVDKRCSGWAGGPPKLTGMSKGLLP